MDGRFELCFPHVQVAAVGHDLKAVLVREEEPVIGVVIGNLYFGIGIILRSDADALARQLQIGGAEFIAAAQIQVIVLIFIGRVIDGAGIVVDLHLTVQIHSVAADAHTAAAGKGIAAELRLVVMDLDHTAAGGADIQRTLGKDTGALAIKPVTARRADIILDNAVFYLRRGAAGVVQASAVAAGILVGRLSRPGVGIVQRLVAGEGTVFHGKGAGIEHTAAALGAVVGEGHHRVVADSAVLHDERALVEHTTAAVVGAVTVGGFAQKRHGVAGDGAIVHGELTRGVYIHTAAALKDRGIIADLAPVQIECAPHVDKHTAAGAVAAFLLESSGVAGDLAAVHVERSAGNSYTAGAVVAEIAGDAAAPQVEGSGGAVAAVADIHGSARSLFAPVVLAVGHRAGGLAVRQVEGNAAVHLDHAALVAVFADDAVSVQAQLHTVHRLPDVGIGIQGGRTIVFHLHVVQQVVVARRGDGLQAADARPCRLIVVGKVAAVGCIVTHAHAVGVGAVLRALHPQAAAAGCQHIRPIVAAEGRLHGGAGMLHHKAGNDLRADADVAPGGVKGAILHGAGVRAGVDIAIGFGIKANVHIVVRAVGQRVVLDTDDAASVDCRAVADDEALALIGGAVTVRGIAFVVHTAAALGRRVAGDGTAMHNKAAGTAVYTAAVAGGGVIPDNAARLHGQHAAGHIHRTLICAGTHMVLDDSASLQRKERVHGQRKSRIAGLHAAAVHRDVLQRQSGLVPLIDAYRAVKAKHSAAGKAVGALQGTAALDGDIGLRGDHQCFRDLDGARHRDRPCSTIAELPFQLVKGVNTPCPRRCRQ